jgi:UDP-glucose 4-epimerase
MRILVTGGAGYVGSIVTEGLLSKDYKVVVIDNLHEGHKEAVLPQATFIRADIGDDQALSEVFSHFDIDAVMHMAADSLVEISMTDPQRYFQNNVINGINLLNTMLKHNVKKLIFSSSAAIYGEPQSIPITEDHPQLPLNAYGETKIMFEKILKWYGKAYGIKSISLRYFNAAGASDCLGEDHQPETHLIPNVLKAALDNNRPIHVFGTDYPTKDGTCVRDYVHVRDIAQAHVLALSKLDNLSGKAYNLGSGKGYSVLEVVREVARVSGNDIPIEYSPKRAGDPAVLLASSSRARSELGWEQKFSKLDVIVGSAWKWIVEHPKGY